MADISIANLPAFLGSAITPTALSPFVDVADTSESPLGTTKRLTFQQLLGNFGGQIQATTVLANTVQLPFGGQVQWASSADGITVDGATDTMRFYTGNTFRLQIDASGVELKGTGPQLVIGEGSEAFSLGGAGGLPRLDYTSTGTTFRFVNATGSGFLPLRAGSCVFDGLLVSSPSQTSIFVNGSMYAASAYELNGVVRGYVGTESANQLVNGSATNDLSMRVEGTNKINIAVQGGSLRAITVNTNGSVVIGTDPGGTEILRVGGSMRVSGTLAITGGFSGVFTAGGFAVNSSAINTIPFNAAQTQFDLANGASATLANNFDGYGLFYLVRASTACLVAYTGSVLTIIWQTGGFSLVQDQPGTVNMYYNAGPVIQNLIAGVIQTFHVVHFAL